MTSGEEPAADQSIERLFLTSSDSEDEACSERENCKNALSSERKDSENELNDEKKELENKISKERKDSENEMSNEDVDSKGGMSSRGEDLESKTSIEIQDSDDEKLFIDSEGGTYNECEESKSGAWGEGEDWGDEEWEALVASMKANEDLQDNEELNDANSSTGNWFAGTMSESDHEFEVMDIFHRKCYGCFLKKCVKKLGRFGLEKPSSSDEEEVEPQICESSTKPATDAELPEVNSETAEDQNLQIDTADSSQASVIAEDMIPAVSLAEKHEKEIRVDEEHKPEDGDEIEKNDSQVTGSDKEKEKSQEEREMISKIEICRPTSIVPETQGPRVPKEEQAFVPYTFYSQHSSLTEKEHIHYVAMSLQRASGAAFVHREDKKKFSTIKEKLTEENEKFNDEVRQLTTAMHKNRYHTLPTSIRSYVQDIFLARIQRLCRYAPRAYDLAGQCSMDSDVYTQSTPVLEFSKCLLVVGNAPSVQLPNLKRKAIIRYREVAPVSERYPANFHLEKKPISADPNVPLLLEKYNADVVASSSSLKTILADFGPFHSGKYDIPVYIKSCKVKGTLKRVIFLLKPLVSTKLSVPQLLSYIAKYALQMNLLVEPTEENKCAFYRWLSVAMTELLKRAIVKCPLYKIKVLPSPQLSALLVGSKKTKFTQ
ncbi:hypothetical protein TTRE_0000661601 [Trichuris trichiura]|uniref:Uncharacterized protein n=1 Tax=Trichuris trichiura TaxID=36087 RepID=A0A077ZEP9_TRITR|nr:hypothetical protein TTRE_0000661601 [Trichuris trichiura]